MPLLRTSHPFPDAIFGLWQITEDEAFFRADLPLSAAEESELTKHQNALRRLEWLAGRWLLHKLTGSPQRLPLAKDAFSKPFFPENQDMACSLSHSKGSVGALVVVPKEGGLLTGGGCDIQVLTDKMPRIAHKFLNAAETQFVEGHDRAQKFDLFHLFWTAKESLYKAYGLKKLDFRKHIFVENLHWDGQIGHASGRVEKDEFRQVYALVFSKIALPEEGDLITAVCR
jgi:phosphopantetheinyl transferase